MPPVDPVRRALTQLIIVMVAGGLIAIGCTWLYINHVVQQNNQRWCALLTVVMEPDPEAPPVQPTAHQRAIAEQLDNLRRQYRCT